jgi:hypothetical protein
MNGHDRSAENVNVVPVGMVAYMCVESIPGPAVIREIADTDDPLTAVSQLSAAYSQRKVVLMELQISLAKIEGVAHVGSNFMQRQPESMRIDKLHVAG